MRLFIATKNAIKSRNERSISHRFNLNCQLNFRNECPSRSCAHPFVSVFARVKQDTYYTSNNDMCDILYRIEYIRCKIDRTILGIGRWIIVF